VLTLKAPRNTPRLGLPDEAKPTAVQENGIPESQLEYVQSKAYARERELSSTHEPRDFCLLPPIDHDVDDHLSDNAGLGDTRTPNQGEHLAAPDARSVESASGQLHLGAPAIKAREPRP
jgi:hypothetical protein